ncbi:MAG: hypothetical protein K0U68_03630 [Gammaproteobacteria bacterium]|nr:hypothetical protein [Gammaproteobacteria bacterium]
MLKSFAYLTTLMYLIAAVCLVLLALTTITWAVLNTIDSLQNFSMSITNSLQSVGAIIISIAVIDVAKYLVEEEVIRDKELRSPDEARKTITKIFVIISIATAMEGLVYIFKAGTGDITLLVYPGLLIMFSSISIVCLGAYQLFSIKVEKAIIDGKTKKIAENA